MELKLDLGALIQSQVSERLNINLTLLPLKSMKKLLLRAAEIDLGLQQRLWYFKYLNVCNICNSLPQGHWSALLLTLVPQHWVRAWSRCSGQLCCGCVRHPSCWTSSECCLAQTSPYPCKVTLGPVSKECRMSWDRLQQSWSHCIFPTPLTL